MPRPLMLASSLLALLGPSLLARADADVFILRRADKSIALEKVHIADDAEVSWTLGKDGFIDVILPPGPGGSAGIVQSASSPTTVASCRGGTLSVVTTAAGRRFERPVPPAAELRALDIHVSARAQDGTTLASFIRAYDRVEPDRVGVIEDPFGGAVPLQPGDCVIYTTTFESRVPAAVGLVGEAPVRFVSGHHLAAGSVKGGATGDFVIDLAAGTTIVSKGALPPGVAIDPAVTAQYSADGVKRLAAELGGATGAAAPLGIAHLPELTIGGITFRDVEVMVMNELPPVAEGVVGILGLDLLSRASIVSLPYPKPGALAPIRLGTPDADLPKATLPLALLGSRAYCRAKVDGADVCMIVDSGSPVTILEERAARTARAAAGESRDVRGIGPATSKLRPASVHSLALGSTDIADAPVQIGALPLFARFKGPTPVGILGNATLSKFSRIELDFERAELRLYP